VKIKKGLVNAAAVSHVRPLSKNCDCYIGKVCFRRRMVRRIFGPMIRTVALKSLRVGFAGCVAFMKRDVH